MEKYYLARYHKLVLRLCAAQKSGSNEVPMLILALSNLSKELDSLLLSEKGK
mgnify:CR=1 FL=1